MSVGREKKRVMFSFLYNIRNTIPVIKH